MDTKNQSNQNLPAKKQSALSDQVLNKVNKFQELGEIKLPKDYSAGNAIKAAWLILQETKDKEGNQVLNTCSNESIANSLFEMVISGLSVVKKQVSFVAFGGKLTLVREYPGTVALARRFADVKEVTANVIYKGDEFQYEIDPNIGRKKIIKHIQKLENINENNITGAYATLIFNDGTTESDIMPIAQIRAAWNQGHGKGNTPAHRNFPSEMAKKTVIHRVCKLKINSSDDSGLYSDDSSDDEIIRSSKQEINDNANKEEVDFQEYQDVEDSSDNEVVEFEAQQGEEPQQVNGQAENNKKSQPDF